jgi:FkbM family methyltransferase
MARYVVGLAGELVRQGVSVTLLHPESEAPYDAHIRELGCDVRPLRGRGGVYFDQVAVPLALLRGRFDLYHAPGERGVPLVATCPVVLTIHSLTGHSYRHLVSTGELPGAAEDYLGRHGPTRSWWTRYVNTQFRRAGHILTPSQFSRREILRFLSVPESRVSVTPLAVHEQFHRARGTDKQLTEALRRLNVERPYLLYVGGYEAHKNVRGLIDVFARVRATRPAPVPAPVPGLSLVMVGSKGVPAPVPADLPRYAAERGLMPGRDVIFLSNLSDELTDLYDGAELFVTLSWRETFCLPALEAMTRGVPVIASAWGATCEVVGDSGRLVDPRDHAAAANAIVETLAATDRVARSQQAQCLARRFRWADTAEQTLRVYESLVEARQIIRPIARRTLMSWGRVGRAQGLRYQAIERWGGRLASSGRLQRRLPNGCRVHCDLRDEVQRQIYFWGCYEPVEAFLFSRLLRPGMTVVDAGANVGQYTLLAGKAVGASGSAHAFEPVPKTFALLGRHVAANELGNVRLNRAALWCEPKMVQLGLSPEMAGNSGAYSISTRDVVGDIESPAIRFDDYVVEQQLRHVDIVKMDVEGAELCALRGMSRMLRRDGPLLLMEINRVTCLRGGHDTDALWKLLAEDLGYRGWAIGSSPATCRRLTSLQGIEQRNVLFHRADLPSDITDGWDLKSVLHWARGGNR